MRNIIVLVGKAATGKDEIEIQLSKHYNVKRLVSHTTRPMRENEIDGENYYFTTQEKIKTMIDKNETVEHTSYIVGDEKWIYALSKDEINSIPKGYFGVVTVNPHGIKQLLENDELKKRLTIIYIVSSDEKRKKRYFERDAGNSDTQLRWEAREKQDSTDFIYFENTILKTAEFEGVPVFIYDNTYDYTTFLKALGVKVFNKVDNFVSYEAYIKDCVEILESREGKLNPQENEFPAIVYDLFINRKDLSDLEVDKKIIEHYVYLNGKELS